MVACRRAAGRLSPSSGHARHADFSRTIPHTPAKKEGGVGGLAILRGHRRLTISPACANLTLLTRRVAHLAQREASEGPRWTGAVEDDPASPLLISRR